MFKTPEEKEAARRAREQARQAAEAHAAQAREQAERAEMQRRRREQEHVATLDPYEFRVLDVGSGDRAVTERAAQELQDTLTTLGGSGWRVASTILIETDRGEYGSSVRTRFILERPAPRA